MHISCCVVKTHDALQAAPADAMMTHLYAGDLKPGSSIISAMTKAITFKIDGGTMVHKLSHVAMLDVVRILMKRMALVNIKVPSLQKADTCVRGLNHEMMMALLAVYCEMHTTVVLAICAHNMLVDIKSHDVSKEHVGIMRCCRAAINDFEVALAHEHVNDLESNDFALFVPITLCKQWLGCMKMHHHIHYSLAFSPTTRVPCEHCLTLLSFSYRFQFRLVCRQKPITSELSRMHRYKSNGMSCGTVDEHVNYFSRCRAMCAS